MILFRLEDKNCTGVIEAQFQTQPQFVVGFYTLKDLLKVYNQPTLRYIKYNGGRLALYTVSDEDAFNINGFVLFDKTKAQLIAPEATQFKPFRNNYNDCQTGILKNKTTKKIIERL